MIILLPKNIRKMILSIQSVFRMCLYKIYRRWIKILNSIGLDKNNLFVTNCIIYFRFTSLEIDSIIGNI